MDYGFCVKLEDSFCESFGLFVVVVYRFLWISVKVPTPVSIGIDSLAGLCLLFLSTLGVFGAGLLKRKACLLAGGQN